MIRMNDSMPRGETATSLRIRAVIRPAPSATPAPSIATNVTATTPNPAKFATNDVKMNRIPSTVRRLWIAIVCSWISNLSPYGSVSAGPYTPGWTVSS